MGGDKQNTMKVINHRDGHYHYVEDSVMYGSIFVTRKEWETIYGFLVMRYMQAKKNNETYTRDALYSMFDFAKKIELAMPSSKAFCIGVEATRLVFEAFAIPRYKRQNYSITIID